MRRAVPTFLSFVLLACAQNSASDPLPEDAQDAAPQDPGYGNTTTSDAGAGGRDTGTNAHVPDASHDAAATGGLAYQCPLHLSEGCVDGSRCESTCLGQYQAGPTCAWFSANATRNDLACNPVGALTALRTCPSQMSKDCSDATKCESTCVGQYQAAATCAVHASSGALTDVPCDDAKGKGPLPLYACPDKPSTDCERTSDCQSTCVGQLSSLATCTYRGPGGVGTDVPCTAMGTQSF